MLSPILYAINNFDAKNGVTIKFYYTGEQVFANKLTIKNNETLEVVYEEKISSMQLYHEITNTVSSAKFSNGTTYIASITVFDKNDNESPSSNTVLFTCYSTPIFQIINISDGDTLNDASYPVQLKYSQTENIALNQYIVTLYNYGHNQIWTSGAKYDNDLSVTLTGLVDNESYYIRATGDTVAGVSLDTGYIGFSVDIVSPDTFLILTLENVPEESSIKASSNIIIVEGRSEGDLSYIDNAAVDLTKGGKVIFDDGFSLKKKDFTIGSIWKNLIDYSTILELTNGKDTITVTWNKGDFGNGEEYYAELIASTKINSSFSLNYIIQSNHITLAAPDDGVKIVVYKKDNLFDLQIKDLGVWTVS